MGSESKTEANRRNAQLSTGPADSSVTRYNATTHGIYSSEVFIDLECRWEDREEYSRLAGGLWEDWAPIGAREELKLKHIINFEWRLRRLVRYETAQTRRILVSAIESWEERESRRTSPRPGARRDPDGRAVDVASVAEEMREWLVDLEADDPLETNLDLYLPVCQVAKQRFKVPIRTLLGLPYDWLSHFPYSYAEIRAVIDDSLRRGNIAEPRFWFFVRERVTADIAMYESQLKHRLQDLARDGELDVLPPPHLLETVGRYETRLRNQLRKTIHDLEALQASRQGISYPPPLRLDINVDGEVSGSE